MTLQTISLCASCDRCRSRKTKCDGSRPCGNCATRYKKANKNKCDSLEGVDISKCDCVYSPAKRRGPVPGKCAQHRSNQAGMIMPAVYCSAITSPPRLNGTMPHQQVISQDNFNNGIISLGLDRVPSTQLNNNKNNSPIMPGMISNAPAPLPVSINNTDEFSTRDLLNALQMQHRLFLEQLQMQQQGQVHQLPPNNNIGNNAGMTEQNNFLGGGSVNITSGMPTHTSAFGTDINISSLTSKSASPVANNTNQGPLDKMSNYQSHEFFQQQQQEASSIATMPDQRMQSIQNNDDQSYKRAHTDADPVKAFALPNLVATHQPLLHPTHPEGVILRSYYELSANDILNLPPIPTDEEYCALLNDVLQVQSLRHNNTADFVYTRTNLPLYDQSALNAARFSELALGALANNQVPLALELSNTSVMCLKNCIEGPSHISCLYDVARAYLLHGIFRSFRGDTVRYFKYRRVCLTYIVELNVAPHLEALLAAISFHDAWAYMMHNASEDALPDIDTLLPSLKSSCGCDATSASSTEEAGIIKAKYDCSTNPSSVATDPINQMWMQGPPQVFLNNEASLVSRCLDGFACAIRSCCDQANAQFEDMANAMGQGQAESERQGRRTPTATAVLANEHELCSRNIVLSAQTLLNQHDSTLSNQRSQKFGLQMVAMAMNAFLENGQNNEQVGSSSDGGSSGGVSGLTHGQIKNLLEACEIIIQHPLLLHSPGPCYHMASNAAIMLCHLLNGIYSNCSAVKKVKDGIPSKTEDNLFDRALDTFMAMRKILNIHRNILPVKLRCHGLPRPNVGPFKNLGLEPDEQPFIELGDTSMCSCKGCQGFVIMGCSPCVAAEQLTKKRASKQDNHVSEDPMLDFGRDIIDMDDHFDDALLALFLN